MLGKMPSRLPRATLAAACCAALLLTPAAASAKAPVTKKLRYDYLKDKRAWYWRAQVDENVESPVDIPEVGQPSQRVQVRNPQNPDTLPVAVHRGEHERISALYFNLFQRGVLAGSKIRKFKLEIRESDENNEQPQVRPGDAKIIACGATEFFAGADDPQEWKTRPDFAKQGCAQGKRDDSGEVASWTFDLTSIAKKWGQDPFANNNGVVFVSDIPQDAGPDATWQVNLKVPARDRDRANAVQESEVNEYRQTKNRLLVVMEYVPGEPLIPEIPEPPTTTTTPPETTTTTTPPETTGSSTVPSTDFGSAAGTGTGTTTPTSTGGTGADEPTPQTTPAASSVPEPRLPGYVWILLPLGLLALAAVRSVVLEPVAGTRPDGPIATIRRRNLERRGAPIRAVSDPFATAFQATREALGRVGRGVARIPRAAAKLRSVRRK
jgi:hypothetical protein